MVVFSWCVTVLFLPYSAVQADCSTSWLLSHVWLCNPMDCSTPGSSVHWIFQARILAAAAAAKSLQSCPTLCDPIDGSPPGSAVPGILQARTLEWVAISFSNAWKWKVKVKSLSRVQLLTTTWPAAYQAPPSMGFFQARIREWIAIFSCHGSFQPTDGTCVSCVSCVLYVWWVSCFAGKYFTAKPSEKPSLADYRYVNFTSVPQQNQIKNMKYLLCTMLGNAA